MTVEVTPVGLTTISYRFYIIWTVMNLLLILPCVYFFFPETKGLSLEAIDGIFANSNNIFEPVWVAKKILKGEHPSVKETAITNGHDEKHGSESQVENADVAEKL